MSTNQDENFKLFFFFCSYRYKEYITGINRFILKRAKEALKFDTIYRFLKQEEGKTKKLSRLKLIFFTI